MSRSTTAFALAVVAGLGCGSPSASTANPSALAAKPSVEVAPDPCAGVRCDSPPSACFAPSGTCTNGACSYPYADGAPCDDGDRCTTGDACMTGACAAKPLACPSVVAVSAGDEHTCALTTTGAVKCWGDNTNGQLGDNSTTSSSVPVDVVGLSSGALAVSAGRFVTCALTATSAVKCWGDNHENGQLGNGAMTGASNVPVDVVGLSSGVRAISAGMFHACAVTAKGAVKCWGSNGAGQLGNNSTNDSPVPVGVVGLSSGVIAVVATYAHTCALTAKGAVKCWGDNMEGPLGNTAPRSSGPVDVGGLSSGVVAIAAGYLQTCAVTTKGALKCWGNRTDGRNAMVDFSKVPVDVGGLSSGVRAVSAGRAHTCALTDKGAVRCWGFNEAGQLGNNATLDSPAPVDVVGLSSGVLAVSASGYHACAILEGGAVKCWGRNKFGQLGNNSTSKSLLPVQVVGL